MLFHSFLIPSLCLPSLSYAVTLYSAPGQLALTGTATADASSYTGAAAYNPKRLDAPALPSPMPALNFPIALQSQGTTGLSINQFPGFYGFSIEMSVVNQVLGKNSTLIQVPFLNLMATLREKSGWVNIRVGGNSQENAHLSDQVTDGKVLQKDNDHVAQNPTHTPQLLYNLDLLYMMRNISDLVGIHWFLGMPFADKTNVSLDIMVHGQEILGDYLLAMQVGNEPDLYPGRLRDGNYTQFDFVGEWGDFINAINANPDVKNKTMLMGPSISNTHGFKDADMWATGFVDKYTANIAYLTVEHYPRDNCGAIFLNPNNPPVDPQSVFHLYLDHNAGSSLIATFADSPNFAQSKGKRYLMMETNTASCGGFPGISDSFGAAIWGVDYAMTLAYRNFSGANFHVGGQGAYYNPFTPPPTNQSSFHQWTVGPTYYSALVVAEALGNKVSQVLDLGANNQSIYTPAYAIYENGVPVRVLLVNFMSDATLGASYTASISIDGAAPAQVKTKVLSGTSVSDKYNFTWGGQTFGNIFEANGRLKGDEQIVPVPCSGNSCDIKVPSPGVVLVYLTDDAVETAASPTTFTTSVFTKVHNTATVDRAVLATSNGMSGKDREQVTGSTSVRSANNAPASVVWSACGTLSIAVIIAAALRLLFVPSL